jgi:hypothetical protein
MMHQVVRQYIQPVSYHGPFTVRLPGVNLQCLHVVHAVGLYYLPGWTTPVSKQCQMVTLVHYYMQTSA